ncbi:histone-lysine N-methyltransferase PRDM9-like [Chrysoperla carnea]|uniref:histone-lysine N-methyltransferase PRDM9-like n=1 Tax=Chrysoperla carnea TaxID=189513 RepID=UPI001D078476|nr:histone-lysine N-methyltransferase PRDM9-like [Chrysoperla carnea]XP_044743652.1 histone-lysine N-methyltransferase PRDM9-like [Chrysoperla carnea]
MATLSSDNYQLKWHSFGSHLHTSVATLFQSEYYTDTILCTSDGHQVNAHRFLLSLCSAYFQNIFKSYAKANSTLPLIVIMPPDIDIKTLKTLIQYIYCGETTVSNEILENVLKAGDLLKIRGLWRPKDADSNLGSPAEATQQANTELLPKKTQKIPQQSPIPTTSTKPMPMIRKIVLSKDRNRVPNILNVPPLEPISNAVTSDGIKIENVRSQMETDVPLRTYSNIKLEYKKMDKFQKINPKIDQKKADDKAKDGDSYNSQEEKHGEKKLIKVLLKNPPQKQQSSSASSSSDIPEDKHHEPDEHLDDTDKYLVIKEEPIEWDQLDDVDLSENELFQSEMTIKPEIIFPNDEEEEYQMHIEEEKDDNYYSPLTCELCSETFTIPADWVRHIEGHSDLYQPAKRQRRGRSNPDDDNTKLPPLVCDLCQKILPTPAEWVRHIQQTHTEKELAASNNSNGNPKPKNIQAIAGNLKVCSICSKRFPSHASMVIHARTHTGERPFLCTLCNKGFNVKSNLLRHLRTLHDKIINSADVGDKPEATCSE